MKGVSVHRKYLSRHNLALVLIVAVLHSSCNAEPSPEPQFSSDGFIDSEDDLLALPSDAHPQIERSGPITSYAFDQVPLESNPPGAVVVPPPQSAQQSPQHNNHAAGSNIVPFHSQDQQLNPTVFHPAPVQIQHSAAVLPFYAPEVVHSSLPYEVSLPVAAASPLLVGPPTTVYVPHAQHAVSVVDDLAQGIVHGAQQASFLEIYQHLLKNPHKALEFLFIAAQRLAIPKDHYLNVISFAGIYLFMSYLFYNTEDVLQTTCEVTGGNKKISYKEWHYHVGRRFVPALPVDQKLQKQFLKLFRGPHLEDDGSGSSSEEDFSGEIGQINELMPKGSFFYSLSPIHIEAWQQLQRLFVMQKSPNEVFHLARDLLYHHKVNPKIWYLGLIAAAQERPDMTGFTLAHPLDAMPDWFIPAHLIKDEMDRYRRITDDKHDHDHANRIKREVEMILHLIPGNNSTYVARSRSIGKQKKHVHRSISYANGTSTTTLAPSTASSTDRQHPDSGSAEVSGEFVGLDGSIISSSKKGGNGDKLDSTKAKKSKGEVNEETVEISDKQLQEAMLRHSGSLARQTRNKVSGEPRADNKHRVKTHGSNRQKGDGGKNKQGKGKGGKGKGKGKGEDENECIRVDGRVGLDNGIENKLWYWREDIMMNQHHWYWHQVYPLNATRHPDRRAELFFFMHRSFLARYNAERLSNGLHRTYELDFQPGGILHEGYDPHLADLSSGKHWAARPPKQPLTDIIHLDDPNFSRNIIIPEILGVYSRLLKAIKTGKMITKTGKYIRISHGQGIEPFSNTLEASELSVNPFYYDAFGLHNHGHIMIAFASDPLYKQHLPPGPMAEQAMSMRDPAFYPYHTFIDNLFEKFKSKLAPYKVIGGEWPLLWRGVEVHHVEILSKGNKAINQLRTFWTDHKFELSPGVDRSVNVEDEDQGKVCAVHLSHEPFLFKFVVVRKPCTRSKSGKATIRIFMAPRYDEKGRRFHMNEQRRLMFQLDAFQVKLRVGKNIITRRSHDSSLTKPWSRTIKQMELAAGQGGAADFCGCGWPQHLYIPKGNRHGMPFDLFVMATNYDEDRVEDSPKDLQFPEPCNSPYIFCGHPRRRYPDKRPLYYPFDRPVNKPLLPCHPGHSFGSMVCQAFNMVFLKEVDTLEQFTSRASNMRSLTFTIKHIDHFYPGPGWASGD